jgi:hypothetical protein
MENGWKMEDGKWIHPWAFLEAVARFANWPLSEVGLPNASHKRTDRLVPSWLNFRIARDTSAVGNGKQRKARSADREPHDYCGKPVL